MSCCCAGVVDQTAEITSGKWFRDRATAFHISEWYERKEVSFLETEATEKIR